MLEIERFGIWLPKTGVVLDDVTLRCQPGEVWGVVGRTSSGASTLLHALAGRLPTGARVRGKMNVDPRDVLYVGQLPQARVLGYLGGIAAQSDFDAASFGLQDHLQHRTTSVPPDVRTGLLLATLCQAPHAPVVLVDAVLTAAAAPLRRRFAAELRRRASAGSLVLWADHELDTLWTAADHFLELDQGRVAQATSSDEWIPTTLPEPTLLTLSRLLGVPVEESHGSEAFRDHASLRKQLPTAVRSHSGRRSSTTIIPAEELGLIGSPLEFGVGESVGLVDRSGRPERTARRISKHLGGDALSSHLPRDVSSAEVAHSWARRHGQAAQRILETSHLTRVDEPLSRFGTGDVARLRAALSQATTTPLWLPHIQAGLDPRERHDLATTLAKESAGLRLITGRDVDFLVRACQRIIVLDGERVLDSGSPRAMAAHLPDAPVVSDALGSRRFLRLTDIPREVV